VGAPPAGAPAAGSPVTGVIDVARNSRSARVGR